MKRPIGFIAALVLVAAALLTAQPALANTETLTIVQNTNGVNQATIGGTVTPNDRVTITVHDAALPAGQQSIHANVNSGDTLKKIAKRLANRINANADLEAAGVTAESNESIVTIVSRSTNSTSYTASTNAGATETIALSVNSNPVTNAVIAGSLTTGDELRIIVHDVGIASGQRRVSYIVQAGDTLQSIAQAMALDLSSKNALDNLGITATAAANIVTIRSYSPNSTTYTSNVIGAHTETISFAANQNAVYNIVVGGSVTNGDVIAFEVDDQGLPGGQKVVGYAAQPGDDLPAVAAGLMTAVNGDSDLTASGITATSTGSVISLTSNSTHTTTYQIAQATQVSCENINPSSPGVWPPANATRRCFSIFPTAHHLLMREALESIGNLPSDAAARLKSEVVPAGDSLSITVHDVTANQDLGIATYTTVSSDSTATIATNLAVQVNGLDPTVNAVASGSVILVFSANDHVLQLTAQNGAHGETIIVGNPGTSVPATVSGNPKTDITWRIFESRHDYNASAEPENKKDPSEELDAEGISYIREGASNPALNEKSTSVFEHDGMSQEVKAPIKSVTAHETGHQLDFIYGKIYNSGTQYSATALFLAALDLDKVGMNGTPACAWDAKDIHDNYFSSGTHDPDPNSGHLKGGLFTGLKDGDPNHTGATYVCNGTNGDGQTPNYSGDNLTRIRNAYPAWKVTAGNATVAEAQEIFAELAAEELGFPDTINNAGNPVDGSHNFEGGSGGFVCTHRYVSFLIFNGRPPSSAELAPFGYDVPDGTSSPYGTGFTHYSCDGSAPEHHDFDGFGA